MKNLWLVLRLRIPAPLCKSPWFRRRKRLRLFPTALPFKGVLERLERRTLEVRQSSETTRAHGGTAAHRGGTLTPTESWGTHTASRVPRVLLSWHGADGTGPQL
ncbi:hypothetical protein MHYP_G00304030 [Metynnis hypsauchen]